MELTLNEERRETLQVRARRDTVLGFKGQWCQSHIGKRLWEAGRLFPDLINKVTHILQMGESCSISDLQRRCRLPIRLACYLSANSNYELSKTPSERSVPEELAKRLLSPSNYDMALEKVKFASGLRGEPALIYGQRFITPESAVCRAALVLSRVKANQPRVAFLGDDDLTSIALASLSGGCRITVMDIDKRVLETIRSAAISLGLDIDVRGGDLSEPIPEDLKGRFDCFVADPYPTSDASFEMCFINRGIEFLDREEVSLGLVTFAPTHKFPAFRRFLLKRLEDERLDIREVIESACEYELIPGELTPLEYAHLEGVARSDTLISHAKSYLLISPGEAPSRAEESSIPLEPWLQATRSHDLTLRLGGEERLRSELDRTVNDDIWKRAYKADCNVRTTVDVTHIMSDLTDCEEAGITLNGLLAENKIRDFYDLLYSVTDDRSLAEEGSFIAKAARRGSTTPYSSYSLEFELYLLARIYESYFRGSSPLRTGGEQTC